ncbi:protein of unknown function [Streptomyces sp. KY75]|nr:protein of unknown function [Streptomyces sp. KY75]CAD5990687.1 protein of unknown function [Streptomyces sp. KY70]
MWRPRITRGSDLIRHSDRGLRYVSIRYTDRLADIGAFASVGSGADSYDNAMAEALNGTSKAELIETQHPWKDVTRSNGRSSHGSPGTTENVFTPRSTTFRPPSTREPSGEARSRPCGPPEPRSPDPYETRGSSGCAAGVAGQGRRANQARCQRRPAESAPTPP